MTSAFIRKNTHELRNKLAKMGYHVCVCTEFEDAVWLHILIENKSIHGIGYFDSEYSPFSQKTILEQFLYENSMSKNPEIDCLDNEEKFLNIAKEIINGKNSI